MSPGRGVAIVQLLQDHQVKFSPDDFREEFPGEGQRTWPAALVVLVNEKPNIGKTIQLRQNILLIFNYVFANGYVVQFGYVSVQIY